MTSTETLIRESHEFGAVSTEKTRECAGGSSDEVNKPIADGSIADCPMQRDWLWQSWQ
jgi:hypothetical protein